MPSFFDKNFLAIGQSLSQNVSFKNKKTFKKLTVAKKLPTNLTYCGNLCVLCPNFLAN